MENEIPRYYCPKCHRLLRWSGDARNGHGEGLWTAPDGSQACGDCLGKASLGSELAKLNDARITQE